jgi:hypothetical protein
VTFFYQYQGTLTAGTTGTYATFTASCTGGTHAISGYCGILTASPANFTSGHVAYSGPNLTGTTGATAQSTDWLCWIGHGSTSTSETVRYGVLCQ